MATQDDTLDLDLEQDDDGALEIDEDERAGDDEGQDDHGEETDGREDEGQEGQDGRAQDEEQVSRRPSRAAARVETALREAREAKEELARLRAEQVTGRTEEQNQRAAQAEQDRLVNMDPEERFEYRLNQERRRNDERYAQLEFRNADSADRTAFEGLCARNPVASKLNTQVEEYLAQMRRGGTNAPRETVLKYVIGERALANAGKATGKVRRQADTNRTNQTTRAASPRGDTGAESRRGGADTREARAKRLENIQI